MSNKDVTPKVHLFDKLDKLQDKQTLMIILPTGEKYKVSVAELKEFINVDVFKQLDEIKDDATKIINEVKSSGNKAIIKFTDKFDGVKLSESEIQVTEEEINKAYDVVDKKLLNALKFAKQNLIKFHEAQIRKDWSIKIKEGVEAGQMFRPLESVGLYARSDHLPEELSGGEQQRVAIARALAHDPAVIYADEPTGNLDTHIGMEIINLFKQLAKEQQITIIMVTHDSNSARETDRIYILQKGKLFVEEEIKTPKKSRKKRGSKK